MNYSVLIFDLDDTLLDFQAGEKKGLAVVFNQFITSPIPYEDWLNAYTEINRLSWVAIEQGEDSQTLLNQRFSKTFAVFNQKIDGIAAEAVYRQELNTNYALLTGAKEFMDELATSYEQLIAGTNGKTATQYQRLAHTSFDSYFKHIVISDEIGHAKPSKEFFDHIFALYPHLPKEQFLMIGDTLGSDILGAQQSGIDSVWFNPQQKKNTKSYEPTYMVQNFEQLLDLLLQ